MTKNYDALWASLHKYFTQYPHFYVTFSLYCVWGGGGKIDIESVTQFECRALQHGNNLEYILPWVHCSFKLYYFQQLIYVCALCMEIVNKIWLSTALIRGDTNLEFAYPLVFFRIDTSIALWQRFLFFLRHNSPIWI